MKILRFEVSSDMFRQFMRYGVIGILNTILMVGVFNLFIWLSGISTGGWVVFFYLCTFVIVLIQSFIFNKRWVFKHDDNTSLNSIHKMFVQFFLVSAFVALINLGVVHLVVNIIGAPAWIGTHAWANVAILVTIVVSVMGNFTGYKLIVFKKNEIKAENNPV